MSKTPQPSFPQHLCPTCKAPAQPQYVPFCSERCAKVDLWKWLNESYKVPTEEAPPSPSGSDE